MSYFYIVRHRAHHDIELPLLQDAELHFTGFMTPYMIPVSVNKTLLLGKPLPCNPEAETALQPLIWHAEGLYFQGYYFLQECFFFTDYCTMVSIFYDTRVSAITRGISCPDNRIEPLAHQDVARPCATIREIA